MSIYKKPKILAVTLARGGSKGIPRKNIKKLAGKPLIAYTIEEALKVSEIKKIIVSTDCNEIANIAINYGAEVPFLRPPKYSGDKSLDRDFFIHAINTGGELNSTLNFPVMNWTTLSCCYYYFFKNLNNSSSYTQIYHQNTVTILKHHCLIQV